MSILDNLALLKPQLSEMEVSSVTASIAIRSKYIGKVAITDRKDIATNTIQTTTKVKALLANAKQVKAITPLCIGVSTMAVSLSLLIPTIIKALNIVNSIQLVMELYLACPLFSILAVAASNRTITIGVQCFSKFDLVGRIWLSSLEQIQTRWIDGGPLPGVFLPNPIVGSMMGGQCIVVMVLAAAKSMYF
ncbi:hypothetical protein ACHAXS_000314 [Conticribra weissflogii]